MSNLGEQTSTTENEARLREAPAAARRGGTVSRKLWAAAGLLCFGLGCIGVALPVLPTTPFVLLAAFCFARSSEKIDAWFKSTKLYKRVFETYVQSRTMTVRGKLTVLVPVTLLLAVAAFFMRRITWMLPVLALVWIGHVAYFGFMVKTAPDAQAAA